MSFTNNGVADQYFSETVVRTNNYDYDEIRNVIWYCDTDNKVIYSLEINL